jgi:hypothetical protein
MIVDGATNWGSAGPRPSAEGFDIEARSKSIYEWVRQVRGGVLAGAFTIERHISAAIIYFVLGERVALPEVQEVFDEGLLGPLSFERRIYVVMLMAPKLLKDHEVASLKSDLNELRTLRNAMAHKPFWFHPELNDQDEVMNLVPMIQRGKAPLSLTTNFVEQVNKLIASLIERSIALAEMCQHVRSGAAGLGHNGIH